MPSVTVRYWAGARRAAARDSEVLHASTLGEVLEQLSGRPRLAEVVQASSFLVDGVASGAGTSLTDGQVIDVLPPFAGG